MYLNYVNAYLLNADGKRKYYNVCLSVTYNIKAIVIILCVHFNVFLTELLLTTANEGEFKHRVQKQNKSPASNENLSADI